MSTITIQQITADLARVTAERDAAVARNIILHQQKTEEAEAARVDRVPVADYYQRVREVLERRGADEAILDEVRDLPGWDGTEGGYLPGLTTTTFVYRSDLDKAIAERDALQARLDDYHDDHRAVVAGQCAPDEHHCSCVPHLRREVEAMRAVVDAICAAQDEAAQGRDGFGYYCDAVQMARALRTRKAGE